MPFFCSPLLSSVVSPIVFTVIVELPSTNPSVDVADFSVANLDVLRRNRKRDFALIGATTCAHFFFDVVEISNLCVFVCVFGEK